MGKIWIEVCIISARGLRRSSSFWKLQWYTVGWIDPNNKYCTKIDASGTSNPVWKTKFAASVDDDADIHDMMLHVEVYSREPVFLRERLQGTASVGLKQFMTKYNNNKSSTSSSSSSEEVGSYQLRKRNSSKPQGFVDISIRISEEKENQVSYSGNEGGLVLMDNRTALPLSATEGGYPAEATRPWNQSQVNIPYQQHSVPYPANNYNPSSGEPSHPYPSASGPGPSSRPPRSATPPPPPPPPNVGYIPTFMPRTENYVNMPSSVAGPGGGVGPRPGFAMGVGAGALAAGAVLFGDDFMSGFDVPAGFQDASLTISTDPPF